MKSNRRFKCPHCGELFARLGIGLIPTHDFPKPCRRVCPGSKHLPRDASDKRPLWKGEEKKSPHAGLLKKVATMAKKLNRKKT